MKTIRIILICVTILAVLAAGLFVVNKYTDLELFGKGMQLEKTANVVTEIRNISEFVSACYYEELVLTKVKNSSNTINKVSNWIGTGNVSKDEICLIANGKVRAGFNLSKLTAEGIRINGDTLAMNLPATEIFDVIVNPSNYDVYVEDGNWSHEEVAVLQAEARARIEEEALKFGILEQADKIGRERLSELLKSFGFKTVILN